MNKFFDHNHHKFLIFVIVLIPLMSINLFICTCDKKAPEKTGEVILAKISDKNISVDEFIRRSEYTIRPPYCKSDNYIHRKIILNSLIAEKLLALEAGENNELTQNEQFQDYIRGRQEQAMRQLLYHQVAYQKVKLDTNELKTVFNLAGRTYKIFYLTAPDSNQIHQFKNDLSKQDTSFEMVYRNNFGLDEIPRREVDWDQQNEASIHDALFSRPLKVGQIIGPIKTEDDRYLLMEIAGWTDRPAISDTDIQKRWNDVSERLTTKYANQIYAGYISGIMKGKRLEFARDTFFKLTEIFGPFYLKSLQDKQDAFTKRFWNDEALPDTLSRNIENIMDHSLLQIDGQTWTVSDFMRELRVHPLVFRKRKMSQQEFSEQFRLAIVDMIRDRYIADDAYRKGYDKAPAVQRNRAMWQDHYLALYQKNQYLTSINADEEDYLDLIELYLNTYVDSLQKKYNDIIEIDTDAFEQIKLTRIDLFVLQKNVPFPIIVPSFPLITTHNKLDYGRKMETNSIN